MSGKWSSCGDPNCEICGPDPALLQADEPQVEVQVAGPEVPMAEPVDPLPLKGKRRRVVRPVLFNDSTLNGLGYTLRFLMKVIRNETYYKKYPFPVMSKSNLSDLEKLAEVWENSGSGAVVQSDKIPVCEISQEDLEVIKAAEKVAKKLGKPKGVKKKKGVVEITFPGPEVGDGVQF